jgi:hypothetical protein
VALTAIGIAVEGAGLFPGLRFAVHRRPADMPSTRMVPAREIAAGHPLISVSIDRADLTEPGRGLLVNPTRRGRDWERFAYVSYFEHGALRFASGVGLRVHGGRSRVAPKRKSFGLYFRRRYGAEGMPSELLFAPPARPLERLVLHNDARTDTTGRTWHFVNPLAYDIAARIGALTVQTKPARFFLNGELQDVYVLTERIDEQYFETRFGHRDFQIEATETSALLRKWATTTTPFSMPIAAHTVDLDNLTRWAISILFCGTTDIWQGTLARDRRTPGARWFWVNWDMDHSFMDLYGHAPVPWEIDSFARLLRRPDPRSRIIGRLLELDPNYRTYFAQAVAATLNHRLTPAFLAERLSHYRVLAAAYGVQEREFVDVIEQYFAERPRVMRALVQKYLGAGPVLDTRIRIPDGVVLQIDGQRTAGVYEGRYFSGSPLTLAIPDAHRGGFLGWRLNGRDLETRTPSITLLVNQPLDLTPRFAARLTAPPEAAETRRESPTDR